MPSQPCVHLLHNKYFPIDVPQGHLFMLGDNLDWSTDSRFWGFLEKKNINGKVRTIIWSWDSEHNQIRWKRIGQPMY
jgi:signal peptidase I